MSSTGETDIANTALARLGVEGVESIDDDVPSAVLVKSLFDMQRDYLLSIHPWNFATIHTTLNTPVASATPAWGFSNAHLLPPDFRRMQKVYSRLDDWKLATIKVDDVDKRCLMSNSASISIAYITKIKNLGLMTEEFKTALSMRIAYLAAMPLRGDRLLARDVMQESMDALAEARFQDSQQSMTQQVGGSSLVDARRNGVPDSPIYPGILSDE